MTESEIKRRIQLAIGRGESRVWNNPVGLGWQGKLLSHKDGVAILQGARAVRFGLAEGSPDLIGFVTLTVTPEMVGQKLAVFLGVEVKTDSGRPSVAQTNFINFLLQNGARAGIARSTADAIAIVKGKP